MKKRKVKKKAGGHVRRAARKNPDGRVLIGANAEKLFYSGGNGKSSKSRWVHTFETPVRVYGMPDGSVLLESMNKSVSLWDFYPVEVI